MREEIWWFFFYIPKGCVSPFIRFSIGDTYDGKPYWETIKERWICRDFYPNGWLIRKNKNSGVTDCIGKCTDGVWSIDAENPLGIPESKDVMLRRFAQDETLYDMPENAVFKTRLASLFKDAEKDSEVVELIADAISCKDELFNALRDY